jgi:hypothetical protein
VNDLTPDVETSNGIRVGDKPFPVRGDEQLPQLCWDFVGSGSLAFFCTPGEFDDLIVGGQGSEVRRRVPLSELFERARASRAVLVEERVPVLGGRVVAVLAVFCCRAVRGSEERRSVGSA